MAQFFAQCPDTELHNLYGPTEAAIDVSHWACTASDAALASIPIGAPIHNTQLYVCNAQGQPVPRGASGELLIGGVGLARGYLNRPQLTAEKFAAHPLAAGARLYRTGDLARSRADGYGAPGGAGARGRPGRRLGGCRGPYRRRGQSRLQLSIPVAALPVEDGGGAAPGMVADSHHIAIALTRAQTQMLLHDCHRAYHTHIDELLLAGLYLALQRWSGKHAFRIDVEGHGREALSESIDLSQTAGWFTVVYPLVLALVPAASAGEVIAQLPGTGA